MFSTCTAAVLKKGLTASVVDKNCGSSDSRCMIAGLINKLVDIYYVGVVMIFRKDVEPGSEGSTVTRTPMDLGDDHLIFILQLDRKGRKGNPICSLLVTHKVVYFEIPQNQIRLGNA